MPKKPPASRVDIDDAPTILSTGARPFTSDSPAFHLRFWAVQHPRYRPVAPIHSPHGAFALGQFTETTPRHQFAYIQDA